MAHQTLTQILLWMRKRNYHTSLWMAKNMMRAFDPIKHPTVAFKATFDFAAIRKHAAHSGLFGCA
ncbi:hypothetical protein MPC1_5850002 [Methylocella tundrae]|nr:hypothetical protein MPC1_5850002 [Methylocella tundrae]